MRWLAKIPFIILGLLILLAVGRVFFFGDTDKRGAAPTEKQEEEVFVEPSVPVNTTQSPSSLEVMPETTPTTTTNPAQKVTPEDCEQECEGFSIASDAQAYCFSFCGLNQETYQGKDCETLPKTEQDACFKEQAIRERNGETCARIGESSLRKVCEARIAEELFD